MKKTLVPVLALSLFASIAVFADGNQGSGNRNNDCTNPDNCPPAECTEGCDPGRGVSQTESTVQEFVGDVTETVTEWTEEVVNAVLF